MYVNCIQNAIHLSLFQVVKVYDNIKTHVLNVLIGKTSKNLKHLN